MDSGRFIFWTPTNTVVIERLNRIALGGLGDALFPTQGVQQTGAHDRYGDPASGGDVDAGTPETRGPRAACRREPPDATATPARYRTSGCRPRAAQTSVHACRGTPYAMPPTRLRASFHPRWTSTALSAALSAPVSRLRGSEMVRPSPRRLSPTNKYQSGALSALFAIGQWRVSSRLYCRQTEEWWRLTGR